MRLKNLLFAVVAVCIGFTSCSEEDELYTDSTISVLGELERTVTTGDTIIIDYSVSSGTTKIDEIEIMKDGLTYGEIIDKDVKNGLEEATFEYIVTTNDLDETIEFDIRVTDKLGIQKVETISIEVVSDFSIQLTETEEAPHKTEWNAGEEVVINFTASIKNFAVHSIEVYKSEELVAEFDVTSNEIFPLDETFTYQSTADDRNQTIDFTFKAIDKDGVSYPQEVILSAILIEEVLETTDFEWKRTGGADAIGLDQYGLAWTSNTSTKVIIKKDADKLVVLDKETWGTITNAFDLKEAVDNAEDKTDFREISSAKGETYDTVIATKKGDEYFLIHITKSTIDSSDSTVGTVITITGESKQKPVTTSN